MAHASPLPAPWFDAIGRTSLNPNPFSICSALSRSPAHPSPLEARMSQLGAQQPSRASLDPRAHQCQTRSFDYFAPGLCWSQGHGLDGWWTQGLRPEHDPRFLCPVTCCHTGNNDCGVAGTTGSQLENSSTPFSPHRFSPQAHRDPGMNDAAIRMLGKAVLLPGSADPG